MKSELELLRTLAEAEDDVKNGRLAPVQDSFDQLRASLLDRKKSPMYRILRTDKAEDQLREAIFYIAEDSGGNVDVALAYLGKIESAINRLQEFPKSGSLPRYSILKKQGYRVLVVERHLVFYKINEGDKLVVIYAIIDGRREYLNLI